MKAFYNINNKYELGIDEAGRGPLFGPVFVAGVILPSNIEELCIIHNIKIKDSKKLTKRARDKAADFIKTNALHYYITYKTNLIIDEYNILKSVMMGMHEVIDNIQQQVLSLDSNIDLLLIDGNYFKQYLNIPHICIEHGDNEYLSIAAASILAKTSHDEYINNLIENEPELIKYDLQNNMGYGTKKHMDAIKQYGITKYHRRSFKPCSNYK